MTFQPSAEIIADSLGQSGDRMTTFVLTYHRMIHSEFMTHRMLSKNSSSSRAIPIERAIAKVVSDDVYPLHWGQNQKGMVAEQEVDEMRQKEAKCIWASARQSMIDHANALAAIGIHKQVANRLIEPFSTITVICSGTEYQNFFKQRCHPDAQPEIQALANKMKAAYDTSKPKQLAAGDWHLPLLKPEDFEEVIDINELIKVVVGRCARVSYLNHNGVRSLKDDIRLHDSLISSNPQHLSPLEHAAIALPTSEKKANLTGFQNYRNILEEEGSVL